MGFWVFLGFGYFWVSCVEDWVCTLHFRWEMLVKLHILSIYSSSSEADRTSDTNCAARNVSDKLCHIFVNIDPFLMIFIAFESSRSQL